MKWSVSLMLSPCRWNIDSCLLLICMFSVFVLLMLRPVLTASSDLTEMFYGGPLNARFVGHSCFPRDPIDGNMHPCLITVFTLKGLVNFPLWMTWEVESLYWSWMSLISFCGIPQWRINNVIFAGSVLAEPCLLWS